MVTQVSAGVPLTDVEEALVEHVVRGELLDLARTETVDQIAGRHRDALRGIRAVVLRDILRGRLAADPDPRGLRLRGAHIVGRLDLDNLTTRVAVELYDCHLDGGLAARDAHLPLLVLSGCRLGHVSRSPLRAERLTAGMVSLSRTVVTGACPAGAVRLTAARLGELRCAGAVIRNACGPALHAAGLRTDGDVFLADRFEARGAGTDGAVLLRGAHLGGRLVCDRARLVNRSGPALSAAGLRVDLGVFLTRGFEAVGAGDRGAVRLVGAAHIGGDLQCDGGRLVNHSGPALLAEALQVDRNVWLCNGFEAVSGGHHATLVLSSMRIGGTFVFDPARLENTADSQARLDVDGLTYPGQPRGLSASQWLRLLREGTPTYAAQPYQQLAAVQRAAGHDGEVRRILMAQRRDQISRDVLTGHAERAWARLTGLTLGHGYQPWRALLALLAVVTAAVVLALTLGAHGGLARVGPAPADTPCSVVERIGVGLDIGLPLANTGTSWRCEATTNATGHALTVAGWTLQLSAWAFATLFVAGFTSAVRKT